MLKKEIRAAASNNYPDISKYDNSGQILLRILPGGIPKKHPIDTI
jgi:hypothetical protein